jgi:hypothetical protein
VSKKQLWFFAYKSKEFTGENFECEFGADYPTKFKVGTCPDGSEIWAKCTKDNVNGPYWANFPTYLVEPL